MDLFKKIDKLFFQKEKNGIDKKIDDAFHTYAENNPIMNEAKAKIEEAADAKLDYCPHCNTRLPEGTLKDCCEFEFKEK